MNLLSFFNPATLLPLGVLVLLCSLLFVYFEGKAREQNHKISSMLSLVSSLTEEVQTIRRYIQTPPSFSCCPTMKGGDEEDELISVSDDDEDSCDDESYSSDESCDDSCDDSYDEELDDDSTNVIEIGDNIKILTLLEPIEIISDNEGDIEDEDEGDIELEELGELDDESSILDGLESVSSKEPDIQMFDLKTIHLEEPLVVDYKKLSIGKLRSIVFDKGLSADSSKLKKHEILKLLGVE
jgi:hypothetical protein